MSNDQRKAVVLAQLDVCAAFDAVDHSFLLVNSKERNERVTRQSSVLYNTLRKRNHLVSLHNGME